MSFRSHALTLVTVLFWLVCVASFSATPQNDLFANRTLLSGTNVTAVAPLTAATVEIGEPGSVTRSVWWSWTAPSDGTVVLSSRESDFFGSIVAVYTGTSIATLTDLTNGFGDNAVRLPVLAGATYEISVADRGQAEANVVLTLQLFPAPPNDNFADRAALLTGTPVFGWTLGATSEPNEQQAFRGPSVWWQWTAPATARATARLTTMGSEASLAIFPSNSLANLYWATAVDQGGVATFDVVAGSNYIVGVFGSPDRLGPFQLDINLSMFGFSSPSSNASFYAPASIPIQLRVSEFDGPVERIDLFANEVPLASPDQPPWQFTWANPPEGASELRARLLKRNGDVEVATSPIVVRPSNDLFANRAVVTGEAFVIGGMNAFASTEPEEPVHPWYADRSLWWTWTAPASGVVEVDFGNQWPATMAFFYTGERLDELALVTRGGSHIPVFGGQTYQIALASSYAFVTNVAVSARFYAAPANDLFANAQVITEESGLFTGSLRGASVEPGEPDDGDRSVWWTWTAPADGVIELSLPDTFIPSHLVVYTGSSVSNLTEVGRGIIDVKTGRSYHIAVRAYGNELTDAASFDIHFQLEFFRRPANDDFANRAPLSGLPVVARANASAATAEPGEPAHAGEPAQKSVWWSWTAPKTEKVSVLGRCCSTLGVYRGDALGNLAAVPGQRIGAGFAFDAIAGETYAIGVDNHWGYSGEITIMINDCPNDNFADRIALSGIHIGITNVNIAATAEAGEPSHGAAAPVRTMWWTWRAPYSGTVKLERRDDFLSAVAVYTGSNLASLTLMTNLTFLWPPTVFEVVGGSDYQIAVGSQSGPGYGEQGGYFELRLNFSSFHLSSPESGLVGTPPREITLQVAPTMEGIDGVPGDIYFYTGSELIYSGARVLGHVRDSSEALTQLLDKPGVYPFFALATNAAGQELRAAERIVTLRPPNDDFANRIYLSGASLSVTGYVAASTLESGEPTPDEGFQGSVWWSWTCPASGKYAFRSSSYQPHVFVGDSIGSLVAVPTTPDYLLNAEAAQQYQVQILKGEYSGPEIRLDIFRVTTPANDDFADRTELVGSNLVFAASTLGASREPEEPVIDDQTDTVTTWWKWTAPANGVLRVVSEGTVRLYQGTSLASLVHLPELENGYFSRVNVGTEYELALTMWPGDVHEIDIHLEFVPAPSNDNFTNSVSVSGSSVTLTGTTAFATREPQEPPARVGDLFGSIWWSWTAPATRYVYLITTGSITKPFIQVFQGAALGTLTNLLGDTEYASVPDSFVFRAEAGQTYHISVNGVGYPDEYEPRAGEGPVSVELIQPSRPANDDFVHATVLSGTRAAGTGDLLNATFESGEPEHRGLPSPASVWFSWTAPSVGRMTFRTTSGAAIAVYQGDSLGTLVPIVGKDVFDDYAVEFTTVPNTTYRIAVASYFPILDFPFELHFYSSPANDFFVNRSPIIGAPAQISTSFLGATPEPGTQSENGVDLWWTWRAPASGVARLAWVQSEYTPVLFEVYSGSSASNLALLAQAYNELSFPVAPGRSYEFRVSAWSGETNLIFALGFWPQPSPSLGNVGSDAGHFSFDLYGLSGQALRLETSTNLMDWESIGLHTLYGSRDRFTDTNALSPARFYRASPVLK